VNRDLFVELFDTYGGEVRRYALRRVGPDAADDVVEETFLVAWRRRHEVPDEPLPWLYRTAGNVVANHRRGANRGVRLAARSAAQPSIAERDPAERIVERRQLAAALAGLSDADREALLLVGWEELDLVDAARVAGCSVVAFRARLHRARRRLRRHLQSGPSLPPLRTAPTSPEGVRP
jgi:RNA polymerase sigma-70 factor, ECF subfamily